VQLITGLMTSQLLTDLIILAGLLLNLSTAQPTYIDLVRSDVQVVDIQISHIFGEQIDLQAKVETNDPVEQIQVFIQSEDTNTLAIEPLSPTPDGEIYYIFDLTQNPVRAFSELSIWFEISMEDGTSQSSEKIKYKYNDNRFEWQSIQTQEFNVSWYQDDPDIGQRILDVAYEGLERINNQVWVPAPDNIRIYAYASVVAMQDTLMFSGGSSSWIAGHADPDLGTVVVSLPPGPEQILEIRRQIPHELVHILLYEKMGPNYSKLPRWLNEGLASTAELFPNPDFQLLLDKAHKRDALIPIRDLNAGFPIDAANFQLSYAEAYAFTWYLQQTYGKEAIEALIQAYTDEMAYDEGIQATFDLSLDALDSAWRQSMFNEPTRILSWHENIPLLIVSGLVFIVPIGLMTVGISKRRKKKCHPRCQGLPG